MAYRRRRRRRFGGIRMRRRGYPARRVYGRRRSRRRSSRGRSRMRRMLIGRRM